MTIPTFAFDGCSGAGKTTLIERLIQALTRRGLRIAAVKHAQQDRKQIRPSIDEWLSEAKADPNAAKCGMYLTHVGTVRETAKRAVRQGDLSAAPVTGMRFDYDREKVDAAIRETYAMAGVTYVRAWLNRGELSVGDDIMLVLIGGDIRPHVVDALQFLVGEIKTKCVQEIERSKA